MFTAWMKFALDSARLCQEMQEVMALRMLRLASGGVTAQREAQLMLAEKSLAFAEAASILASGASMHHVLRRYQSIVSANKRRLSRH
jgi:hypothetical protein